MDQWPCSRLFIFPYTDSTESIFSYSMYNKTFATEYGKQRERKTIFPFCMWCTTNVREFCVYYYMYIYLVLAPVIWSIGVDMCMIEGMRRRVWESYSVRDHTKSVYVLGKRTRHEFIAKRRCIMWISCYFAETCRIVAIPTYGIPKTHIEQIMYICFDFLSMSNEEMLLFLYTP